MSEAPSQRPRNVRGDRIGASAEARRRRSYRRLAGDLLGASDRGGRSRHELLRTLKIPGPAGPFDGEDRARALR